MLFCVAYRENICEVVRAGKLLHCKIYKQDIFLSKNKVRLINEIFEKKKQKTIWGGTMCPPPDVTRVKSLQKCEKAKVSS